MSLIGHGSRGKPNSIILHKNIIIKWLLMTYCYTYRLMPHSAYIRDRSFLRTNTETHELKKMQRVRNFGALSSKWNVFSKVIPLRIRDLQRRGSG